jgi:hypothetical protein
MSSLTSVVSIRWHQPLRRWSTPTGDPCPRTLRVDGSVVGTGDCTGCGFCLLLAALVDAPATAPPDRLVE